MESDFLDYFVQFYLERQDLQERAHAVHSRVAIMNRSDKVWLMRDIESVGGMSHVETH